MWVLLAASVIVPAVVTLDGPAAANDRGLVEIVCPFTASVTFAVPDPVLAVIFAAKVYGLDPIVIVKVRELLPVPLTDVELPGLVVYVAMGGTGVGVLLRHSY